MAQAAFETTTPPARPARVPAKADSPSPAMRGIVFAVLLSLPFWAIAGYVAFVLL